MQQIVRSVHQETKIPQNSLASQQEAYRKSQTVADAQTEQQKQDRQDRVHLEPNESTVLLPDSAVNQATAGTDGWSHLAQQYLAISSKEGRSDDETQWKKLFAAAPHQHSFLHQMSTTSDTYDFACQQF